MMSIMPSVSPAALLAFSFIIRFLSSSIFFLASSLALAASDFSLGLDFGAGVFFAAVLLFFTTSGFCKTQRLMFHTTRAQSFTNFVSVSHYEFENFATEILVCTFRGTVGNIFSNTLSVQLNELDDRTR